MDFDRAFEIIIAREGGYTDDPRDSGGKTKYGITEAVAKSYGFHGDMRHLPIETAKEIYRAHYWDACRCDALPWPLALYVFDSAVNQGVQPAIKMMQRALDTVQDGIIGQQTLAQARKSTPWHWARFMAFRVQRYQSTRSYDVYGTGWITRLFEVTREA